MELSIKFFLRGEEGKLCVSPSCNKISLQDRHPNDLRVELIGGKKRKEASPKGDRRSALIKKKSKTANDESATKNGILLSQLFS